MRLQKEQVEVIFEINGLIKQKYPKPTYCDFTKGNNKITVFYPFCDLLVNHGTQNYRVLEISYESLVKLLKNI